MSSKLTKHNLTGSLIYKTKPTQRQPTNRPSRQVQKYENERENIFVKQNPRRHRQDHCQQLCNHVVCQWQKLQGGNLGDNHRYTSTIMGIHQQT